MNKSYFKDKVITLQIEDQQGMPMAASPAAVLLTTEAAVEVKTEDEALNYDQLQGSGRSVPTTHLSMDSVFSFKTPLTRAQADQPPSWLPVLRACGFNAIEHADHWAFTHATPEEQDSATVRLYQHAGVSGEHLFQAAGCSGNLSIELEAGKKAYWSVSNMQGSYQTPGLVPPLNPDQDAALLSVCETLTHVGTQAQTLGDTKLCIQKVVVNDADGRDLNRDRFFCGDMTVGAPKPVVMEVTFINPDWANEINPFQITEAQSVIQQLPFVFRHEVFSIQVDKVQPLNPRMVELGNAKLLGITLDLNLLSPLQFLVNKGA